MNLKELGRGLLRPGDGLRQRATRSAFWILAARAADQLFNMVRILVLARLLSPNDFGLMGIALLTLSALDAFSQTGFNTALIQKKGEVKDYLDTAFTLLFLRGAVLFALLFIAAPYLAAFFDAPQATTIIRVIGLSLFAQGLTNIGIIYFQKELEFNKQFAYQASGTLAVMIVGIGAAVTLRSVWALVLGQLAANLVRLVASYILHPYRPHLRLATGKAKELYNFGKWVFFESVLGYLHNQGDQALVGKILGVASLGFYQLALRISLLLVEIDNVAATVAFPLFARMQDDTGRLRETYLRALQLAAFVSFPLTGFLIAMAPDLTQVVLGAKWLPIVLPMQILTLSAVPKGIGFLADSAFWAVGKPHIRTGLSAVYLLVLVAVMYPLTLAVGLTGTALSVLLASSVTTLVALYILLKRVLFCPFAQLLTSIRSTLLAATAMTIVIAYERVFLSWEGERLLGLAVALVIGAATYLGLSYVFDKLHPTGLYKNINDRVADLAKPDRIKVAQS
ncbi:MAG: lipopolysaccharide biosynthesis protein [Chloroflexi bacterium]|nr:lipopolysaccharide biosynthesis protein [Chloroflexota bacterium]